MDSSFSRPFLSLVTLFSFVVAFGEALTEGNHDLSRESKPVFAKKQSQQLGCSSRRDANIVNRDNLLANASRIVEKRFRFPTLRTDGPDVRDFGHYAGYLKLPNTIDASMFYYLFKSRKANGVAPVVVYLAGGPGCSGSAPMFLLNGPFHLTKQLKLVWNDFGWDMESNLIYVDQPTGTGFSYSTSKCDIRSTTEEAGVDFYYFLQAFFKKHPEFVNNELYLTGGSFAGHFVPTFALQINKWNNNNQGQSIHINLRGIGIGSAWTYPGLQFTAYPRYALNMKLITRAQYDNRTMAERFSWCRRQVQKDCDDNYDFTACSQTNDHCKLILDDYIIKQMGDTSVYDIRQKCTGSSCDIISDMERFLNQTSVKKALGVGSNIPFVTCSSKVAEAMSGDQMRNFAVDVPPLLQDGIKVLVYVGEFDFSHNWQGNLLWVNQLQWPGHNDFQRAPNRPFEVFGAKAGWLKTSWPLTFLMVKDAGNLVSKDQPKVALEMLRKWIGGIPL